MSSPVTLWVATRHQFADSVSGVFSSRDTAERWLVAAIDEREYDTYCQHLVRDHPDVEPPRLDADTSEVLANWFGPAHRTVVERVLGDGATVTLESVEYGSGHDVYAVVEQAVLDHPAPLDRELPDF